MKKLNKVVKPNWLSDISVQEINIGTFPPLSVLSSAGRVFSLTTSFSKPMLKDLRSDGSITFEAYLRYVARENQPNSKIRITMAFLATIPVGFKSIQVPVVAAVMVKAMEGNMIFSIKPAPSNRIWYGFTTEPVMDIEISLMGAEWKVESSFILNQLKKFLKQAVSHARHHQFRGGDGADACRLPKYWSLPISTIWHSLIPPNSMSGVVYSAKLARLIPRPKETKSRSKSLLRSPAWWPKKIPQERIQLPVWLV
jgi:hypothetical protein